MHLFQRRQLLLVLGDDPLSAVAVRDVVTLAQLVQQLSATDTQACL